MYVTPDNNPLQRKVITRTDEQVTRSNQLNGWLHSTSQLQSGKPVYQSRFNPTYVQISKPEAAEILGITIEEFENRRLSDNRCPKGFKDQENWMDPMRFRLSDIYAYSEAIMNTANPASMDPNVYRG